MSRWPEDEIDPRKSAWRLISAFIFAGDWSNEGKEALRLDVEQLKWSTGLRNTDLTFLIEHKLAGASDKDKKSINEVRRILGV